MIKKLLYIYFILFFSSSFCETEKKYDLTVVGMACYADGIGQISLELIENLKDELNINYIWSFSSPKLTDVSDETKEILLNPDHTPGSVSILTFPLSFTEADFYKDVPPSKIKIAYSMLECTKIPSKWVEIINQHFDVVVVPDQFLIEVYQNSGVAKPIFVIPLGMDLDDYLNEPKPEFSHKHFVFGSTLSYEPRKNHELLIKAFAKEFRKEKNVFLRINGRHRRDVFKNLKKYVKSQKLSNITLTNDIIDNSKYKNLMKSFNCYVNISKGEGFSLCPREALALGIPCILSNNTAQKPICDTSFVRSVPSSILEPTTYTLFENEDLGFCFNCTEKDVRKALRDVYENYKSYLRKAQRGREWVKQYLWKNLLPKYRNLVKPKNLIFGDRNEITDEYLMTNSSELYEKYLDL